MQTMELINSRAISNFLNERKTQKIVTLIAIGLIFLLLNSGSLNAQFIGADFQYEVYKDKIADTIPPSILESLPPTFSVDPTLPTKYKVVLKLYFSCMHKDFPAEQPITIHEHLASMQTGEVNLKLDSVSTTTEYLTVACDMANEQCMKTATYSGVIEVMNMAGGHDITWGTCCWEYSVKNLDDLKMQGLAMVLHVPFSQGQGANSSPDFLSSPRILTCANKIMQINSGARDKDGDNLTYNLIQPYSYEQLNAYGNSKHSDLFPGQQTYKPLVVGRPPFEKVVYAAGYEVNEPMGKSIFSIDKNTGSVDVQPTEAGKYLIGIGVSEYRNEILIGETQRVFLFEVLTDLSNNNIPTNEFPPIKN